MGRIILNRIEIVAPQNTSRLSEKSGVPRVAHHTAPLRHQIFNWSCKVDWYQLRANYPRAASSLAGWGLSREVRDVDLKSPGTVIPSVLLPKVGTHKTLRCCVKGRPHRQSGSLFPSLFEKVPQIWCQSNGNVRVELSRMLVSFVRVRERERKNPTKSYIWFDWSWFAFSLGLVTENCIQDISAKEKKDCRARVGGMGKARSLVIQKHAGETLVWGAWNVSCQMHRAAVQFALEGDEALLSGSPENTSPRGDDPMLTGRETGWSHPVVVFFFPICNFYDFHTSSKVVRLALKARRSC